MSQVLGVILRVDGRRLLYPIHILVVHVGIISLHDDLSVLQYNKRISRGCVWLLVERSLEGFAQRGWQRQVLKFILKLLAVGVVLKI